MPGVVSNRKGVASIGRKQHLRPLGLTGIRQHLMKDGANMRRRIVRRQVKLHGDAFPKAVRVRSNVISGSVAGQDWHWIYWHLRKILPQTVFQTGCESLHEDFFQRLGA